VQFGGWAGQRTREGGSYSRRPFRGRAGSRRKNARREVAEGDVEKGKGQPHKKGSAAIYMVTNRGFDHASRPGSLLRRLTTLEDVHVGSTVIGGPAVVYGVDNQGGPRA